tara:strand:+ start:916 stop:1296 length:381 start_codon:yes stop_codon:yes gene_type:complete
MKVNITMPDALFETYVVKFGLPLAYGRMREAIEAYKDVNKDDRVVLLSGDNRRALEKIFQTTIDDSTKLVRLTQNMNTVKLGNIDMEFSSDQLERLAAQAGFHGRSLEVYMRETVEELKSAMLERV